MINLIPPVAKKRVVREYRLRVISVWLILLSLALLISTALLSPTLMLIGSLAKAGELDLSEVKQDQSKNEEIADTIKSNNEIVRQFNTSQERIRFSELIYTLDDLAGNNVKLTQFSFKETEGKIDEISLIGFADTRNSLSEFKEVLDKHEYFSNIKLPISNLAKDRDITFSMQVTYKEPKL